MKTKNQKGFTHNLVLAVLAVFLLSIVSYSAFNVYKQKNSTKAAAFVNNCLAYTNNMRITCFASRLINVRYANYFNEQKYRDIWKVSDIQGSLGQSPKDWLALERYSNLHNFLECSGFVHVVLYQANRSNILTQKMSSQDFVGLPYFSKINDLQNGLQSGDLVVTKKDYNTDIGHIAVFSNYEVAYGVKIMVTYEASASGTARSGMRKRYVTDFDYGLRYNKVWR